MELKHALDIMRDLDLRSEGITGISQWKANLKEAHVTDEAREALESAPEMF